MSLSKKEIDLLLELIARTADFELNCEDCLSLVAEFADQELSGKPIHEGLSAVRQHLSVCGECREEYEALYQALKDIDRESPQ